MIDSYLSMYCFIGTCLYCCSHRSCRSTYHLALLWPPCVIGQAIIFLPCGFFLLLSFFYSPNLSRRRLDVCHTSINGVALVRI